MKSTIYALALALLMALAVNACVSGDDSSSPASSATLSSTADTSVTLGGLTVIVDNAAVGAGGDQLADTASIAVRKIDDASQLAAVQAISNGAVALSPTYRISVSAADGSDLSGTTVTNAHRITLVPNRAKLDELGLTVQELLLIKIADDGSATSLTYSATPAINTNFEVTESGNITALVTSFSDFLLVNGGSSQDPDPDPEPDPVALTGTLTTNTGVATFNLQDASEETTLTVILPEALLLLPNVPLSFAPENFDTGNPTSLNNRTVALMNNDGTYTTALVGGSVTFTMTSRDDLDTTGTVVGTVADNMGATVDINFTFTTTEPEATPALMAVGESVVVDASATDEAAIAAVFNGTNYLTLALTADNGGTREFRVNTLAPADGMVGTPAVTTPTEDFVSADAFAAAYGNSRIFVVGEDTSDQSGNVVVSVLDENGGDLGTPTGFVVAAGHSARVAYNATEMRFAIAYQTASGISLSIYDSAGALQVGPIAVSADTSATLAGLTASGSTGEFLVTFSETTNSQLHGLRIAADNGALGTDVVIASDVNGGQCLYDAPSNAYLIAHGDTGARMVSLLPVGSDTLGMSVTSTMPNTALAAAGGDMGGVFLDQINVQVVGDVFTLLGVTASGTTPEPFALPYSPLVTQDVGTDFNAAAPLPALAAGLNGQFLLVGRDSGAGLAALRIEIGDTSGG